jgi:hypothetical protein
MFVAAGLLCGTAPCSAIELDLDFTYDSWFNSHPTAKTTLEKAAFDISQTITTVLGPVMDTSVGTNAETTVTFDFKLTYTQPSEGGTQLDFDPVNLPANNVKIFVGMRHLSGSVLGEGGPGGTGFLAGGSGFANQLPTAVQNAAAAANANVGRGGGPVFARYSDDFGLPDTQYTINFGSTIGNLWFDDDSNDNGDADSDAVLNNYWQFDYQQPVGAGKNDFYSVALHELLHALGMGTSTSWNDRIPAGENWNGPQVMALLGTGTNVLDADPGHAHISGALFSTRLSDGGVQQAVMSPSITTGTRKSLTRLDLAFLRDIGWQTIDYPLLPGDFNFDDVLSSADILPMLKALTDLETFRTDNLLTPQELLTLGNLNGDGAVTNRDIQSLLNLLAAAGAGSIEVVPEPASWLILSCGIACVFVHRITRCGRTNRSCSEFATS